MTGIGIAVGLVGALGMSRAIAGLLFGVSATAPAIYAAIAVLLGVIALAATAIPPARAVKIDPLAAIRHDL